jgi:hypothetical protein
VIAHLNIARNGERIDYRRLEESFSNFIEANSNRALNEIFGSLTALISASLTSMHLFPKQAEEDNRAGRLFERMQYLSDRLVRRLERIEHDIGRPRRLSNGARFEDIEEWIGADFGNRLIEIVEINTKNSIELVLNLCSMGAILGFQHIPEIKDIVPYLETVIKSWMGRASGEKREADIKLPAIPPSLAKTIAMFNDVELKADKNGWRLTLKR